MPADSIPANEHADGDVYRVLMDTFCIETKAELSELHSPFNAVNNSCFVLLHNRCLIQTYVNYTNHLRNCINETKANCSTLFSYELLHSLLLNQINYEKYIPVYNYFNFNAF